MATITFNLTQELEQKLKDFNFSKNKEAQEILHELLQASETDNFDIKLLLTYFQTTLVHPRESQTWCKFLRDILIEKLEETELKFTDYEPYDLVPELFEKEYIDGTFTYDTRKTIDYISDFWQQFRNPDETTTLFENDIFDKTELFFLQQIIEDSIHLLVEITTIYQPQTTKQLKEFLERLSSHELDELMYD